MPWTAIVWYTVLMREAQTVSLRGGHHAVIAPATEWDAAALVAYLDDVAGETDFLTFGRGGFGKPSSKKPCSCASFTSVAMA